MNENDGRRILRERREMIEGRTVTSKNIQPHQAGVNFFAQEEFEKAVEMLQRAVRLNPHFAFSYYYLGRSWRRLGNFGKAKKNLHQSIKLNHFHAPSYAYLGDIFLTENKLRVAEKNFRQALSHQFDNLIALKGLSKLTKITRGNTFEVAELLREAYLNGEKDPTILMELFTIQSPESELLLTFADDFLKRNLFNQALFFYQLYVRRKPESQEIKAKIEEVYATIKLSSSPHSIELSNLPASSPTFPKAVENFSKQ